MKLISCPECLDMKKVRMLDIRYCACGKSWGYYLDDDLTAEIGGCAIPIAIANDELREAVAQRPQEGRGRFLQARVLPREYDTLRQREEPNHRLLGRTRDGAAGAARYGLGEGEQGRAT